MARSVRDLALLLSVQAGPDKRAPFAQQDDPAIFAQPLDHDWKGKRVGWLGDLGGALPMEPGIMQTCEQALSAFRPSRMPVEQARLAEVAGARVGTSVTSRHVTVGADLPAYSAEQARRRRGTAQADRGGE